MKKIVMVAAAVAAFGAGAMQVWQVPSWDARITEQGAVKEWIGKTWCGHVQGMCVSSNAFYFSFHNQILKTDWYGREQRWVPVDVHGGDICIWNGRLYTGDVYVPKTKGEKNQARISVYDAETLRPIKRRLLTEWSGAADAITCVSANRIWERIK